jgi:signal peptidase I
MDFETLLTLVVIGTGLIILVDRLFFAPERKAQYGIFYPRKDKDGPVKLSPWVEYSLSLFPILLLVLLLRSFVVEPFRIPSGSLKPTLLIGDFVLVNKFTYGLRLPVLHTKIYSMNEPKLGDVVVFRWPPNPSEDYIKRIVGLPGERLAYLDKILSVNGQAALQSYQGKATDSNDVGEEWPVLVNQENLATVKHAIYLRPDIAPQNFSGLVVPQDEYFVMGDNRDDSNDSRYWGFVPEKNLAGKAFMIWFSWDSVKHRVRWDRIGMRIQ